MEGGKGYKTVCNKTLWLKNARFREILMEIGMMCQETSISTFVDNVDDIKLLLKSISPTVQKLMENGFNETKFTQRVRSVDWNITD